MNKCENCIHEKACKQLCDVHKLAFGSARFCDNFKDKSMFVELPVKVGQTVYVDSRTLPTDKISLFDMGIYDDEIPKFFEGKVISIRHNCKGCFVKIGITTYWYYTYFDWECGEDVGVQFKRKEFTYTKGAFGITVFTDKAEAERKLKEIE